MQLHRHPDSPPSPVEHIEALATHLPDGRLSLVFSATGDLARVRLPEERPQERADGLWRHTCLEAFVRGAGNRSYFEFNLSPSGRWAAYRFDGHRSGMAEADVPPPIIRSAASVAQFGLVAGIDVSALPELGPLEIWEVGLSAVIEADDGSVSHWAIAHPDGPPDFHHDACFAATLPPIG